jgi:hypothetical protein
VAHTFILAIQEAATKRIAVGMKPACANSSQDPISKNLITKNWAGGVA